MSVRNLIFVVLSLVAGTAVSVSWYLEGENEVRAEARALETPLRHVPRTLSGTEVRPTAQRSHKSTPSSAGARPSRAAPSTFWLGTSSDDSSTAFRPER